MFNGTIAQLAAFGLFMTEVMVAVDGTRILTSPEYTGCGCLRVMRNIQQAQTNLAPHSRIVHVVIDRAYIDGKPPW